MRTWKIIGGVVIVILALHLSSCKSNEEKRLEQIGQELISLSESWNGTDSLPPRIKDVDGLSLLIFQRIKENAPLKQIRITTDHKFSEKGLRLYLLTLAGPVNHKIDDFLMTITFHFTGTRYQVMSVSGGVGSR